MLSFLFIDIFSLLFIIFFLRRHYAIFASMLPLSFLLDCFHAIALLYFSCAPFISADAFDFCCHADFLLSLSLIFLIAAADFRYFLSRLIFIAMILLITPRLFLSFLL